jgi:hypothetical protein
MEVARGPPWSVSAVFGQSGLLIAIIANCTPLPTSAMNVHSPQTG